MTEQEKHQYRNFLLEELREGRIELDVARAKAAEAGIELEPRPDPLKFDPKQEAYWTIAMAVAWIQSRDIDKVRSQLPSWRKAYARFEQEVSRDADTGQVNKRWFLRSLVEGGIADLATNETSNQNSIDGEPLMTTESARRALCVNSL